MNEAIKQINEKYKALLDELLLSSPPCNDKENSEYFAYHRDNIFPLFNQWTLEISAEKAIAEITSKYKEECSFCGKTHETENINNLLIPMKTCSEINPRFAVIANQQEIIGIIDTEKLQDEENQ